MASSQKGTTIDIKLTVRYHGLKATQYFAKFTTESDQVFRDDLSALKLPHPKRENTTFISHGCVECEWNGVQEDGVLHKQIVTKSKPQNKTTLQGLSISNITVKRIYPRPNPPTKTNGVKRPNPYAESQATDQGPPLPVSSRARDNPPNANSRVPFDPFSLQARNKSPGWGDSFSHDSWNIGSQNRPYKQAKLDRGDVSSSFSQTSPTFPTFTNLPPLPPRAERMGNARVFAPTLPNMTTRTVGEGSQSHGVTSSTKSTGPAVLRETSALKTSKKKPQASKNEPHIPTGPRTMSDSSIANRTFVPQSSSTSGLSTGPSSMGDLSASSTSTNRWFIKREPKDDDYSFLLQKKAPPDADPLRTSTQSSFQTPSSSVEISEKISDENDKKKGDVLVHDFLKSLKLKTDVQSPALTTTPQVHQSSQKTITPYAQHYQTSQASPLIPATSLTLPLPILSGWYEGSEVPPFRRPNLDTQQTMPSSVLLTPPSTAPTVNTLPASPLTSLEGPLNLSAKFDLPTPHTFSEPSLTTSALQIHPPLPRTTPDTTIDNMPNRKGTQSRRSESNKVVSQGLQRELFDIKREINANVAREAVIIAKLKALKVSSVPAPVKIGFDPSEEMRDRLARLEHELAAERKLRKEAENVIMDIRRECKTPFVVPSLFDAFVDLSKLTTRALRPPSPSSDPKDQPVDMSVSPIE